MKKYLKTLLFFCVLLMIGIFSACSAGNEADSAQGNTWNLADEEPVYVSEFPENKFTDLVPEPSKGTIDYIIDCSDEGRFAFALKDIKESESEEYVSALKDAGYTEIAEKGSSVSIGTLMEKEDVTVSVAYSEANLIVAIIKD